MVIFPGRPTEELFISQYLSWQANRRPMSNCLLIVTFPGRPTKAVSISYYLSLQATRRSTCISDCSFIASFLGRPTEDPYQTAHLFLPFLAGHQRFKLDCSFIVTLPGRPTKGMTISDNLFFITLSGRPTEGPDQTLSLLLLFSKSN